MKQKYTLDTALKRIEELENECKQLREQLAEANNRLPAGRKPHNDQWQADYAIFVEHYEKGEKIQEIVESTSYSRRTLYRYKKYYDTLHQQSNYKIKK